MQFLAWSNILLYWTERAFWAEGCSGNGYFSIDIIQKLIFSRCINFSGRWSFLPHIHKTKSLVDGVHSRGWGGWLDGIQGWLGDTMMQPEYRCQSCNLLHELLWITARIQMSGKMPDRIDFIVLLVIHFCIVNIKKHARERERERYCAERKWRYGYYETVHRLSRVQYQFRNFFPRFFLQLALNHFYPRRRAFLCGNVEYYTTQAHYCHH